MDTLRYRKTRIEDPTQFICVGCHQRKSKAFARHGKIWSTLTFRTVEKKVSKYNLITKKMQEVIEVKKYPIQEFVTGWICYECQTETYGTVTHKHKNGTETWEPKLKLDPSTTVHTTLVPMRETIRSSKQPDRMDRRIISQWAKKWGKEVISPGTLHFNPRTKQITQDV